MNMNNTRLHLVLALLFLLFFVSTSSGLANVSAVQEQLRGLQLKLIKERLKLVQEQILEASRRKVEEEPPLSREELKARVENQIKALNDVVRDLKPRAIEEETSRLESRIVVINRELGIATGGRLRELQQELGGVLDEYAKIQGAVKQALKESLEQKQALLLQQQVRTLEEKIRLTPRVAPAPIQRPEALTAEDERVKALRENIEKAQLRLLQEQSRVIQRKIDELKAGK